MGHPHQTATLNPREPWIPVARISAIVTQEPFDWVQAKLSMNQAFAKRNNQAHSYRLRALVSCGGCHLACVARTIGKTKHGYYVCSGKERLVQARRAEQCPSRFMPAQPRAERVWADWCERITHPDRMAQA